METYFKAPDISCEGCERTIRGALAAVPGVSGVNVDLAAKLVKVIHDGSVGHEALAETLRAAGYPAAGPQGEGGALLHEGAGTAPTEPPTVGKDPVCGMNVSPETVMRDWRLAKAWLLRELGR